MTGGSVVGGLVLSPGSATPEPATVQWAGGHIERVGAASTDATAEGRVVDARGAWVLPGIVDLHGDAFERSLMPRFGVPVDVDLALADNDVQLLAAGITTSFLSATDSWEPGLRGREVLRDIVGALGRRRGPPDVLLHVRHERCNTGDLEELERWILERGVRLLSFNDHTPGGSAGVLSIGYSQVKRSGVDAETLEALMTEAVGRRGLGAAQELRLAAAAAAAGCATASHDSSNESDFRRDIELGVAIAEFPKSIALARRYRGAGLSVLFGAPNLVRGRSHLGNLSAHEGLTTGAGDLLCSDYHYPSLLQAPFVIADDLDGGFGQAWEMVSAGPAAAAGLADRGHLVPGNRADMVVVEPRGAGPARVSAVIVGGVVAYEAP